MNRSRRLILQSNIRSLLKPQCQTMCKMKQQNDLIGPADRISNLHHIKYAVRENETPAERDLRKYREELQAWNEQFWTKHNLSFVRKKKEFITTRLSNEEPKNEMLTADDISVFYKDFLDKNWKTHLKYLLEWYKRNAFVTCLHFKVNIQKLLRKGS